MNCKLSAGKAYSLIDIIKYYVYILMSTYTQALIHASTDRTLTLGAQFLGSVNCKKLFFLTNSTKCVL